MQCAKLRRWGGAVGGNTNYGSVNIKKVHVMEMRPLSKLRTKANPNLKKTGLYGKDQTQKTIAGPATLADLHRFHFENINIQVDL